MKNCSKCESANVEILNRVKREVEMVGTVVFVRKRCRNCGNVYVERATVPDQESGDKQDKAITQKNVEPPAVTRRRKRSRG